MNMRDEKEINEEFLAPELRASGLMRLIALFYDAATLGMFLFMFGALSTLMMMLLTDSPFIADPQRAREYILENEFHLYVLNWMILGIAFLVYQYIYPALKRQTFGMLFTDLVLLDENRKKVTKRRYIKRELLKLLLFPTFLLAFGKERRPLYDRLSKTYLMKY